MWQKPSVSNADNIDLSATGSAPVQVRGYRRSRRHSAWLRWGGLMVAGLRTMRQLTGNRPIRRRVYSYTERDQVSTSR